jgi:hypothetical protein
MDNDDNKKIDGQSPRIPMTTPTKEPPATKSISRTKANKAKMQCSVMTLPFRASCRAYRPRCGRRSQDRLPFDYSMSVIVARAIPDVRDGLNPFNAASSSA